MPTDPKRAKEIFLEAVDLPDGAARVAYLDRACGNDAGLRNRVETLLRSHDPDGSFLRSSAVKPPDLYAATQASGADPFATQVDGENAAEDLQFLEPSNRPDSRGRIGHYEVLRPFALPQRWPC
jgi:hypothetical protein